MGLTKAIYVHLITRTKYNKVCIERDAAKEDIKHVNIAMTKLTDGFKEKEKIWTEELIKQEKQIIKLKKENVRLKEEIKELKQKKTKSKREIKNASNDKKKK